MRRHEGLARDTTTDASKLPNRSFCNKSIKDHARPRHSKLSNRKKRAQGYIDELVVLEINPNPYPFADISSWSNVLPKLASRETFDIDLGKNSLDLNALKEAILSGQNWHDNMLRLVSRLVADGLLKEILDRAEVHPRWIYRAANTK